MLEEKKRKNSRRLEQCFALRFLFLLKRTQMQTTNRYEKTRYRVREREREEKQRRLANERSRYRRQWRLVFGSHACSGIAPRYLPLHLGTSSSKLGVDTQRLVIERRRKRKTCDIRNIVANDLSIRTSAATSALAIVSNSRRCFNINKTYETTKHWRQINETANIKRQRAQKKSKYFFYYVQ